MEISSEDQASYLAYRTDLVEGRLRPAALAAVFVIVPGVCIPPFFIEGANYLDVAILVAMEIAALSFLWLVRFPWFVRRASLFIVLISLVLAIVIKILEFTAPVSSSSIYMALFALLLIGTNIVYPLMFREALIATVTIFAIYFLPKSSEQTWQSHILLASLLSVCAFLAAFYSFHFNKLLKKEYFAQLESTRLRQQLADEKAKSDALLNNTLPSTVAARLMAGETRIADQHSEVTVLFADLVGFTALSGATLPSKVVEVVDRVFTFFDEIVERHSLEKIKTVGDCYMAASGVLQESENHAVSAAVVALEMREALHNLNQELQESLAIRIGLHSGPVIAGVIGRKKMTYDVWGDTVNIASRMESHAEDEKIQLSEITYNLIKRDFDCSYRGEVDIKGKGPLKTYYLEARKN